MISVLSMPSFPSHASVFVATATQKALAPHTVLAQGEFWATLFAFVLIATLGVEYLKKWGLIQSTSDKTLERMDRFLSVLWPDKTALSESTLGRLLEHSEKTAERVEEIYTLSVPSPGQKPPAWCCYEGQGDAGALKDILGEVKAIHRRLDSLEHRIEALEKKK